MIRGVCSASCAAFSLLLRLRMRKTARARMLHIRTMPTPTPTPMPIAVVVLVEVFGLVVADGAGVVGWAEDIVADGAVGEGLEVGVRVRDGEIGAVSDCGVSVVAPVLVVVGSAVLSEDVVVTSVVVGIVVVGIVVVGIVVVGLIPAVAVIVGSSMENLINEVREQHSSPEQQYVSEWLPQRITHSPPPGFSVTCQHHYSNQPIHRRNAYNQEERGVNTPATQ
jgi:hypothetical protein